MHQAQIPNSTDAEIPHLPAADYGKHAEYDETRDQTLKLVWIAGEDPRHTFDDRH